MWGLYIQEHAFKKPLIHRKHSVLNDGHDFLLTLQSVHPTLIKYDGSLLLGSTQQTQHICITFIQCRPNVFDVGPTLYKCYTNVLCLQGI